MSSSKTKTVIIGISGPSSSGKTTVARLLRTILNFDAEPQNGVKGIRTFIVHEDDFYKNDDDIPTRPTPSDPNRHLADWDCASAIDIPFLTRTLQHIQSHASLPSDLLSKEDQNSVGESGVPDSTVSRLRAEADSWRREMSKGESDFETLTIALIDGFLLYAPSPLDMPDHPASEIHDVTSQLTIRLLLRAKHARVKARREARAGYVTLDGFWTDPEGYVDEIVWPGYLRDCGWLFEEGDVEVGGVTELARRMRIRMVPGEGEWGMEKLLVWAFEEVKGGVEGVLVKE